MRAKEEAFRILEAALSIASTGVDEAEVALGGGSIGVTSFSDNQIHPAEEHSIETISLRIGIAGRIAKMVTTDLSTDGLKEVANQLRAQVEHLPEDASGVGLPGPQTYEEVDAFDPETEALRDLDRAALVGKAILAGMKGDLTASGFVAVRRGAVNLDGTLGNYAVANTRGLLAYHQETRVTYSVRMQHENGARGWAEDESFTLSALEPTEIVASAVKRARLGGQPLRIAPGTFQAILEPAAVSELIKQVGLTAGAKMAHEGGSFLSGRIGEKVMHESVTLRDDHTHALHRGKPFDMEGVAREPVLLVENGIARAPVYSWDSATRFEEVPTGHNMYDAGSGTNEGATHLVMSGGPIEFPDLVKGMESGILVARLTPSQLIDSRTLTVSGATRDGLFLIENGEVVAQLKDMAFTVSIVDLLNQVDAMTGSTWSNGAVAPALRAPFPLVVP